MGAEAVNEDQKAIIDYVKNHLEDWMEEKNILPFPRHKDSINTQLLERMIKVEETLKRQNDKFDFQNEKFDHQNEKFGILIENLNKQFSSLELRMDQRFEEMNTRFNRQSLYHLATFTAIVGSAVAIILRA